MFLAEGQLSPPHHTEIQSSCPLPLQYCSSVGSGRCPHMNLGWHARGLVTGERRDTEEAPVATRGPNVKAAHTLSTLVSLGSTQSSDYTDWKRGWKMSSCPVSGRGFWWTVISTTDINKVILMVSWQSKLLKKCESIREAKNLMTPNSLSVFCHQICLLRDKRKKQN